MEVPSGLFGFGLPFLIFLTVLVFVHEMGHFLVARRFGVRVEVFSIGFGPEIFGWTDKARTRWKISLIPLGGYVKMFGDADAASRPEGGLDQLSADERAEAFPCKTLGQRAWIVAAGPLANFIFAIVLLAGFFMIIGEPYTPPVVGAVLEDSAAEQAGFEVDDRIVQINGWKIESFEEIQHHVTLGREEPLDIVVLRNGAEVSPPCSADTGRGHGRAGKYPEGRPTGHRRKPSRCSKAWSHYGHLARRGQDRVPHRWHLESGGSDFRWDSQRR